MSPVNGMSPSAPPTARWETYEYDADMGVRGFGESKVQAFEQAALAVTAVVADPGAVTPRNEVTFHCEASDDELLFAEWLNRLVYEMSSRNMRVVRHGEGWMAQTVVDI